MMRKIQLAIPSIAMLVLVATISHTSQSQTPSTQTKTIAERLGYPADAKLLIVHADDLGVAHSVNEASIKAFTTGLVKSGSIMIPCSWVPEIAAYAKANPQADLGLHLTLTSEWKNYRWGPLAPRDRVSSLLDESGYLYLTESEAAAHAKVSEVETEIRTQIDRAARLGIKPTHLDSHMGTLYQSKELFAMFLKVARENKLPVRISKEWFTRLAYLPGLLQPDDVVLDHIDSIDQTVASDGWPKYYSDAVKNLRPGVTEFVVHIAFDDAEMKAISLDHPNWGAAWRERDFQFLTSDAFRKVLEENNVKLITWRDLRKVQYGE